MAPPPILVSTITGTGTPPIITVAFAGTPEPKMSSWPPVTGSELGLIECSTKAPELTGVALVPGAAGPVGAAVAGAARAGEPVVGVVVVEGVVAGAVEVGGATPGGALVVVVSVVVGAFVVATPVATYLLTFIVAPCHHSATTETIAFNATGNR